MQLIVVFSLMNLVYVALIKPPEVQNLLNHISDQGFHRAQSLDYFFSIHKLSQLQNSDQLKAQLSGHHVVD